MSMPTEQEAHGLLDQMAHAAIMASTKYDKEQLRWITDRYVGTWVPYGDLNLSKTDLALFRGGLDLIIETSIGHIEGEKETQDI